MSLIRLVVLKRPVFQTQKYDMPIYASSCKLNPLGHPANVGKDVDELSYFDEM